MTATRFFAGSAVILAIVLALFYTASSEKEASLFHQSGVRSYDLAYQQKIFNFLVSDTPTPAFVHLKAKLRFRVLAVGDEKVDVALQLDRIDLRMEPENALLTEALTAYYSRVVFAVFRPDGTLSSMAFPGLDENYAGYRQMFMQMEMPIQERTSYTALQKDELGSYSADYSRTSDSVVRTGKHYENTGERSVLVYDSKAEALFSAQKNWYERFSLTEKIRIKKEGRKALQTLTSITLSAVDDVTGQEGKETVAYDGDALLEAAENDTNVFERIEQEQQRAYFSEYGYDLSKLLKEIEADPNRLEGYAKLETYLKLHPDHIKELYTVINTSQDSVARDFISVMESLQLPEAQSLLSEIAADPANHEMNRIRSAIALSGQDAPTQETLSSLMMLAEEKDPSEPCSLCNTALLALGNLSSKRDEVMQTSLPILRSALADASNYNDAKAALLAAKNAGVAPLLNEIIPYTRYENTKLRKLSVSLLKEYIADDAVQAALQQQRLTEDDAEVKKMLDALLDAGR